NDELEALYERATDMLEVDEWRESTDNPAQAAAEVGQITLPAPASNMPDSQASDTGPAVESPHATSNTRSQVLDLLESLPAVGELAPGLDERMTQLRNQIKRLGAINFEAQAEYEALKQ